MFDELLVPTEILTQSSQVGHFSPPFADPAFRLWGQLIFHFLKTSCTSLKSKCSLSRNLSQCLANTTRTRFAEVGHGCLAFEKISNYSPPLKIKILKHHKLGYFWWFFEIFKTPQKISWCFKTSLGV